MTPFRKQHENRNTLASSNYIDTRLTNLETNTSTSHGRNINFNRTMACRPSPLPTQRPSCSNSVLPPLCEVPGASQQAIRSMYQFQPKGGFTSQWPNQQMTFGVMSVPVVQTATVDGMQLNENVPFMKMYNEPNATEKHMFTNNMTLQRTGSQTALKSKFHVTLTSTKASEEQESSKKDALENSFHLIGSVEQVIRWYQIAKSANLMAVYEVHGTLESFQTKGKDIVILMIKQGMQGPGIQGVFCAIDRPFMNFLKSGDNIVCIGLMKGARKMQVLNAWRDTAKLEDYKRISLLCQMALQQRVLKDTKC